MAFKIASSFPSLSKKNGIVATFDAQLPLRNGNVTLGPRSHGTGRFRGRLGLASQGTTGTGRVRYLKKLGLAFYRNGSEFYRFRVNRLWRKRNSS